MTVEASESSASARVRVSVFGNKEKEKSCRPSGWGPVRSSSETARIIEFYTQLRYGAQVTVEYHDLSEPKVQAVFPDLVSRVEAQKLPYPLVTINDQLKLVGSARYYEVLPLVEQAMAG